MILDEVQSFVKDISISTNTPDQEKRIISNLHGTLVKLFQESVTDFQAAQGELKSMKQNIIVRNAEIVMNRKLENDEKEQIVNDPQIIQDMLKSRLLEKGSLKLQNAVSDIEDRHNDIIKLEKV